MIRKTQIVPGQPLKQGEQLVSEDGKFTLELSDAVGLIMRDSTSGRVLWVLDIRPTWGVDRLDMQSDRNLVLYTKEGKAIWAAKGYPSSLKGGERCLITGEGELVTEGRVVPVNAVGDLWSSSSGEGIVRAPTASYLRQQQFLLPRDESGAPYTPGTRLGERTEIVPGDPLKKGERLVAINGRYWLQLSDETGFVLRDAAGRALWNPGIQPAPVDHLSMQDDKNLVLYTADGKQVWSAGISSAGSNGRERCVLEDDGDLVASNRLGVLWNAGATQGPGILQSGGVLTKGQSFSSSNSQYTLTVLQTGNLVVTDPKGATVWMTGLIEPAVDRLVMQRDGNLVLLTKDNQRVWDSGTGPRRSGDDTTGKWLRFDADGTLTVAGRCGTAWSSGQAAPGRLNPGQGLPPGGDLRSARGRLLVQDDGTLVLYDNRAIVRWRTRPMGKPIRGLNLRPDNRLVLYGRDGSELWAVDASDLHRESKPLELRGLGLFLGAKVLMPDQFHEGDRIQQGDRLFSPNNEFQFALEPDGQLTVRRVSDQQLRWSNGVKTRDEAWAYVQDDRNFVEHTKAGPVWATDTGTGSPLLTSGMALGVDDKGALSLRRKTDELTSQPWSLPEWSGWTAMPGEALGAKNGQYVLTFKEDGELELGELVWQVGLSQLFSGESLKPGEALSSKNGQYVLTFKEVCGYLELTRCGTKTPLWSSGATPLYGTLFSVMDDGSLVITNRDARTWKHSKYVEPSKYVLTVTDDGRLLVSEVGKPEHHWFVQ